jgi:ABC-2 type transport system ATP-binding protein
MNDIAIIVKNVFKTFHPNIGSGTIKSAILNIARSKKNKHHETAHHVLKGVSFEVDKGEFLGIVGRNGSGKSTLLKLLAGVYFPDQGTVEARGTLTPFIELGVGFNPELNGKDNIYLNGSLLGFSREEMNVMYNDIVAFAELEDFMDEKLKNYSSGMQVRLAFSIAIKVKSDILLIDEVLAVGDAKFQRKCYDIIKAFKSAGKTVIFVSHSMEQVEEFCDRVIVIDNGEIIFDGAPRKAITIYDELNKPKEKDQKMLEELSQMSSYRSGNGHATIESLQMSKDKVQVGDGLKFAINIKKHEEIKKLFLGFSIYAEDRYQSVFGIAEPVSLDKERLTITIDKLILSPGRYFVSIGLTGKKDEWRNHYDLREKQFKFSVEPSTGESYNLGPIHMPYSLEIK